MQKLNYFKSNNSKIYLGDALKILATEIDDSSIDLIFVDPPYNIGKKFSKFNDKWKSQDEYLKWSYQWIDLCIKKLKSNGTLYLMTSTEAMPHFDIYMQKKPGKILSRIVWSYDSSGVQAKNYYGSMYEPILQFVPNPSSYTFNSHDVLVEAKTGAKRKLIDYRGSKPKPYNNKKVPGNVWQFPRVRYRMEEYENHPSQKPEALLERIILASSNKNDIVLDPFAGTFTTGAVAKKLGRNFIGIESQEEYYQIGLRRLGLSKNFNGKELKKPKKDFVRKNGNGQIGFFQTTPSNQQMFL